jgi:hypothetical protein
VVSEAPGAAHRSYHAPVTSEKHDYRTEPGVV